MRSTSSLVGLSLEAEAKLHSSNTTKVLLDFGAGSTGVHEGKPSPVPRHWDLNLHSGPRYGVDAAALFCSL